MKLRRRVPQATVPTAPFAALSFLLFLVVVATGMFASPGGVGFAFRSEAEAAALPPEGADTIHVKVLSESLARIDGRAVPREAWDAELRRALESRRRPVVALHADPGAAYEAVLAMAVLVAGDPARPEEAPGIALPTRAQVDAYRKRYGRDPFEATP